MNDDPVDGRKTVPLERYFQILELLCGIPGGLGLSEVAALLGLPRATAHRLLANMRAARLVEVGAGRGQHYVLAGRVRKLALLAAGDDLIELLTANILKRLSSDVNETTFLARLEGSTVHSVAMESPDTPWRGFVLPGKILQPHATASGKAIMAFQPSETIDRVLSQQLEKLTPKTLTAPKKIEAHYGVIRKRGYATCLGEVDESLGAIAVPIHIDPIGVRFSLGLVGRLSKITRLVADDIHLRMQKDAKSIASAIHLGKNGQK
ncbi:MAG: IclR family transcriptional regulator [Parvibaculaceae bacterium]